MLSADRMAAALFLLCAVVLAFTGGEGAWALIITVVLAATAGTTLPDLDTPLRMRHRSAILHSALPPCTALLDSRTWPVAVGLGFGIGFHLTADLFPKTMRGFATIKLPLSGSIGVLPSYIWIVANVAANGIGAVAVLDRFATQQVGRHALIAVGVVGIAYLLRTDGGWKALMGLILIGWLILR